MHKWLLLVYKVPHEPTAKRVYVWRKLKKLGAILLHDAVWILPNTPYTLEQFQWLAAEIVEMDGESTLWESQLSLIGQEETLVEQFKGLVEASYKQLLIELEQKNVDLSALSRIYQQIKMQDYFQTELGLRVREALLSAKGGME